MRIAEIDNLDLKQWFLPDLTTLALVPLQIPCV